MRDTLFYIAGIGFLALAKAKNALRGYTSPKPFDISEINKCVEYDIRVVDQWLANLSKYTNMKSCCLSGKNILELGPGSDLGVGIYLLSKGAQSYNACDVNDLAKNTPDSFYQLLFKKIKDNDSNVCIDSLCEELNKTKAGKPSKLNYIVRNDFNLVSSFGADTVDIIFSQAAFEHFDDVDQTVAQLSIVCKPGAIAIILIDLKTHSRWIRDKDPNNIYRYHDSVYKAFWFRGIPNRVRPYNYKEIFERYGWKNVSIIPGSKIDSQNGDTSGLSKRFTDDINQMDYLSIWLCARY